MRNVLTPVFSAGLFVLVSAGASRAQSPLPPDRSVWFQTHAIPSDPESPVVISTEIRLMAADRSGDEVVWSALWIAVTEYDQYGEVVDSWLEEFPTLQTADGFWHVSHADADTPIEAEFVDPPEMSGVAASDTPNADSLEYYIVGNGQVPSNDPYPLTSVLDYSFLKSNALEPGDEGEDEPVNTPATVDDAD